VVEKEYDSEMIDRVFSGSWKMKYLLTKGIHRMTIYSSAVDIP